MSSNATATAPPASSPAPPAVSQPPPSSDPPPAPSSNPPPPSSAPPPPPPASSAPPPAVSSAPPPPPSSAPPAPLTTPTPAPNPDTTQVITASQAAPTTEITTIVVTSTPEGSGAQPTVIVITSTVQAPNGATNTAASGTLTGSARPSSTDPTQLQNAQGGSSSGLSTGGRTAIAVVIPVVVVALLAFAGLFFWRKRKQRKTAEDERRKEVEEYGFNPNHDPTLPAVGGLAMAEDDSGYRGWGNTATSSNRKASTTLTSGMTYSDSNSNPGGYNNNSAIPNSPTQGTYSDAHSNEPLFNGRRETLDSDGIGALGVVNGAVAANSAQNAPGVHRGPSNASSRYSAADHSDHSGDYPGMAAGGNPQEYYNDQGYYQTGPYGQEDPYGSAGVNQQPIIRDVSARRNTRIENPSVFPQQGNSGIAQNF